MLKKLLASLLLSVFLLTSFFVPFVHAQTAGAWYNQDFRQWYTKVYDENVSPQNEIFGERYTAAQVQWVIYGLWSFLVTNTTNSNILLCFMNQDANACISEITNLISLAPEQNLASSNKSFLSSVFQERPLSGITYIKDKLTNATVVPEAKAQTGYGFVALGPVQGLWKGVRNISYTLFIFVILAFAFMIMFRVKISPQTVITVQSVLPKLVIALILATFSYAIAGFMVDLVYVVIGLFSLVVSNSGLAIGWRYVYQFMTGELPLIHGGVFEYLLAYSMWFGVALFASLFVLMPTVITAAFYAGPLAILSLLATILVLIVLLIAAFKILWMLFKAVAGVYLLTIFAPLQIALGSILPGMGFGSWLRSLAANLAVFPITGALFYFALYFLISSLVFALDTFLGMDWVRINILGFFSLRLGLNINLLPGEAWSPPLIGMAGQGVALIFVMTSLAILLIIPKIADIIKGIISGRPFAYGTAIGEAFGAPVGLAGNAASYALGREIEKRKEIELLTGKSQRTSGLGVLQGGVNFFTKKFGGR